LGAFLLYIKSVADPIDEEKKANLNKAETTTLYDKYGREFAKLGSEMREKVTYEQLPEVLIDAIVATEDSRFFTHNGFDTPRFVKAAFGQVLGNRGAGGASTLSMQVIKNSFTDAKADEGVAGVVRKFTDIYLAVFKLEKEYTKEDIVEYYVNNHFLGGNIYGVEEASEYYFGKSVSELNLSEAAIIAGMFKSPTYYKPDTHPENAAARRKTVLYLMRRHGYITKEEEAMANSVPVESLVVENVKQANPYQGYIDTVVKEIKDKYQVNAYTTSLKVYTTLDPGRQDAVNKVLSGETYSWIDDKVQTGVAVIESASGEVIAIGNGRNRSGYNSYNYATQIKRQPGSTAKPLFDYGPGIEYNNWSTYEQFDDAPYSYSNGRSIKNWDGGYYGTITLRRALSTSRNIPALKAFQKVENKKIIDFVTSLGIKPEIENGHIHEAHSIGAFTGVSPLEMAGAYAAFSNGGYYIQPHTVYRIIFRSTGKEENIKYEKKRVMSEATAFMISSVLQDVALTGGTPANVACKTGTTNYDDAYMNKLNMPGDAIRDSWVIGYSTKTTIGMWYGYDNMNQEMVNQGYILHNVPATIQKDRLFNALVWSGVMEGDRAPFSEPSSVTRVGISAGSNPPKLAYPGTDTVYEYFKKGTEPTEYDTSKVKLGGPRNLRASYNESTKKVTLTWGNVDPGVLAKSEYGKFGYNVYKEGKLLGWTDQTTYVANESNPFGTYKVVATYKSYSGVQSEESTVKVTEPKKETPKTNTETNTETPPTTNTETPTTNTTE
ncbi:MAG: transglycosylase domain-containing protein, partial [Bacilli bacterium]|nr:transglycosylase domain-containing protein [Bacilli bacterium]